MMTFVVPITKNVQKRIRVNSFTDEMVTVAKQKFLDFKKNGVILNEAFEDDIWTLKFPAGKAYYSFSNYEIGIRRYITNYGEFIFWVKVYIALRIGTASLTELRGFVNSLLREAQMSKGFSKRSNTACKMNVHQVSYTMEFVRLYQKYEDCYLRQLGDLYLEKNENLAERRRQSQNMPMELCEFESYFLFDWILNDFWSKANESEKNIYYPLYLYWITTTIIPQRPSEYCLIPYDCVKKIKDKYYIYVRRTRMKGNPENIYFYKVEKDYYIDRYEINNFLYDAYMDYVNRTRNNNRALSTLFSLEFYRDSKEIKTGTTEDDAVFGLKNMQKLLKLFYRDVICMKYNYSILQRGNRISDKNGFENDCSLEPDEIMMIRLKDTRHLAMTNLIMRGCSPMAIMEFAGHSDIDTSTNYYQAMSKAVRCRTKYYYDKAKNRINSSSTASLLRPSYALAFDAESSIEVDGGYCHSLALSQNKSDDCIECNGICRYCAKFEPGNIAENEMVEMGKRVDEETAYVMSLLKEAKTESEIIKKKKAVTELETRISNYSRLCWKKLVLDDRGDDEAEVFDERIEGLYKEIY